MITFTHLLKVLLSLYLKFICVTRFLTSKAIIITDIKQMVFNKTYCKRPLLQYCLLLVHFINISLCTKYWQHFSC